MHLHDAECILDTAEVKIDICKECKKKLICRKDKFGRIDNKKYAEDHKRSYLQSKDPLFKKYYNERNDEEVQEKLKEFKDKQKEGLEHRKYLKNKL